MVVTTPRTNSTISLTISLELKDGTQRPTGLEFVYRQNTGISHLSLVIGLVGFGITLVAVVVFVIVVCIMRRRSRNLSPTVTNDNIALDRRELEPNVNHYALTPSAPQRESDYQTLK